MMLALLVVMATITDPPSIKYSAPELPDGGELPLAEFVYSEWTAGDALFIASDAVNLRAAASGTAPVVTQLPMGLPVKVVGVGADAVMIETRVDRWYEIEALVDGKPQRGFVFGATLTPLKFEADLDDDGETEIATVSMGWDFRIHIRVLEPNVTGKGRVTELTMEPAGRAYTQMRGGSAEASLVEKKQAGIALVKIHSAPEMCSDWSENYFSYTAKKPAQPGKVHLALETGGLSDPPVMATPKVRFNAARKTATVVMHSEDLDSGEKEDHTERFTLRDGTFVKK